MFVKLILPFPDLPPWESLVPFSKRSYRKLTVLNKIKNIQINKSKIKNKSIFLISNIICLITNYFYCFTLINKKIRYFSNSYRICSQIEYNSKSILFICSFSINRIIPNLFKKKLIPYVSPGR